MKYVIFMKYKEPIEKNIQKVIEIEKGRIDKEKLGFRERKILLIT